MPTTLGRDPAAIAAARFGGRVSVATITRKTVTGQNSSDSAGEPSTSTAVFTCDAKAFGYKRRKIDGEHIEKADYRVTILLGTVRDNTGALVSFVARPGDLISVPPPNSTTPKTARVVDVSPVTDAAATLHVVGDGP